MFLDVNLCFVFVFSQYMALIRKLFFPVALIFDVITCFRNFLYDRGLLISNKFKTPTIIVGNLSVGGTGKTPQIEYLVCMLQEKYKVAVLSRGYKRKSQGFIVADENSTYEDLGDEPFQYFQKFKNCMIAVDANRTNGILQLEKQKNAPDIILLDDAFQHRKVQGGFSILLTTYDNLYVDDYLFPVGKLRESKRGAKRASCIVVTKCPEDLSYKNQLKIIQKLQPAKNQHIFFSTISYDENLKGPNSKKITDFRGGEILLITGIANPTPLVNYLKLQQINYKHIKFSDHHHFSNADLDKIIAVFNRIETSNKIILTTEKDYVRIFAKLKKLYFIAIKTTFLGEKPHFEKLIKEYVEQGSGNC